MSPRDSSELASLLKRTRDARGLSQAELSRRSGVARQTIVHLESGAIGSPDPYKLQRLARSLGIDAEDLFAVAEYVTPQGLPTFGPYLRARYGDKLTPEARARIEEYFEMQIERFAGEHGDQ